MLIVNKDLGLKAKAKDLGPKAKDSRYQGPIFHRSSPYRTSFIVNVMCVFYMFVYYILSVYE